MDKKNPAPPDLRPLSIKAWAFWHNHGAKLAIVGFALLIVLATWVNMR